MQYFEQGLEGTLQDHSEPTEIQRLLREARQLYRSWEQPRVGFGAVFNLRAMFRLATRARAGELTSTETFAILHLIAVKVDRIYNERQMPARDWDHPIREIISTGLGGAYAQQLAAIFQGCVADRAFAVTSFFDQQYQFRYSNLELRDFLVGAIGDIRQIKNEMSARDYLMLPQPITIPSKPDTLTPVAQRAWHEFIAHYTAGTTEDRLILRARTDLPDTKNVPVSSVNEASEAMIHRVESAFSSIYHASARAPLEPPATLVHFAHSLSGRLAQQAANDGFISRVARSESDVVADLAAGADLLMLEWPETRGAVRLIRAAREAGVPTLAVVTNDSDDNVPIALGANLLYAPVSRERLIDTMQNIIRAARSDVVSRLENIEIPPQVDSAPRFARGRDGKFEIAPAPGGESFDGLREQLLGDVSEALPSFNAVDNTHRVVVGHLRRYESALRSDSVWRIWAAGNALRYDREVNALREIDHDPDTPALPRGLSGTLGEIVDSHNALMELHQDGRRLDAARPGPAQKAAALNAIQHAGPVVQSLKDSPEVFTSRAVETVEQVFETAAAKPNLGLGAE